MERAGAPGAGTPRIRARPRAAGTSLGAVRPAGWWLDAVMVAAFAAVTIALGWAPVQRLDLAIRDVSDAHRPPAADWIAQSLNRLGSGGLLTGLAVVIALWLAWRTRSGRPLAPVIAAFLLTILVIMPVKILTHRAAPHSSLPDDVEVRLFSQADGVSYPSGHAVNTIVWYGVLALLLAGWPRAGQAPPAAQPPAGQPPAGQPPAGQPPSGLPSAWLHPGSAGRRWLRFAPPVIVGVAGTYLGFHWLTDMLAGYCLGVLIDRTVTRLPWPRPRHRAS